MHLFHMLKSEGHSWSLYLQLIDFDELTRPKVQIQHLHFYSNFENDALGHLYLWSLTVHTFLEDVTFQKHL